ncbi:Cardioacceleratory peptide receptor [Gryllus bimaculatus]|nr:Cardioacceleratory peptide receptor [Gryllus bimaculatus]
MRETIARAPVARERCNNKINVCVHTHVYFVLTDLSVGLISVLTDIVWRHTIAWNAGNAACKVIRFLQAVVTYSSTYVLVALSIDRYDAITHPMNFSGSCEYSRGPPCPHCALGPALFLARQSATGLGRPAVTQPLNHGIRGSCG